MIAGLLKILLMGILAGGANVAFFVLVMNPLNAGSKMDEVAINTYVLNFFVGWIFFSAWFLTKVDEEWKKTDEAVVKKDLPMFLFEASKRIAPSIRILYLVISSLSVLSFHLFHIESWLVLVEMQFGVGFMVATTILVLWDLDDPTQGVVNVPNIPADWMKKLHPK